ncbi:MAG: Gfo/Idh/MocA family oxidoreductase [Ignavibacteriae bacterium]|nr:oxidoreductase [Ignavibacteriota bacterium]NOH00047.1 Gfo/Idh/MocA family oxidoreductase [Ignavibacteriota bacterium]
MKQLFKTGNKKFIVKDVPAPSVGDGEILIEVKNSLISSGTETIGLKGDRKSAGGAITKKVSELKKASSYIADKGYEEFLRKLKSRDNIASASGYSVSGIVINKGKNIIDFEIGDRVAAAGSGIAGHAEVVSVPKNLVTKLPDPVDFVEASFTTVGSIALQGVRQANVQLGENAVVIGLGLIGLLTVQILKASGCRVFGIDLNRERVDFAKSLGMDYGFVEGEDAVVDNIKSLTSQAGADSVLICAATPSSEPANQALQIARKKGKVVIVGLVGMDLIRGPFYMKELDFTISCSYGPGRYDANYEEKGIDYPIGYVRWTENRNMQAFLWMLSQKMIDVKALISGYYDIENSVQAFQQIISKSKQTIAVVLNYPNSDVDRKLLKKTTGSTSVQKIEKNKEINFAVLGAGGFASRTHLPLIHKLKDTNLLAVATKTGKSAQKIADDFGANYCSTDYSEILNDNSVDCVIIASRHNLHFPMAIDSLKHKKHILLEKPMGIFSEEVESLEKLASESKVVFAVGYNRRYSPLAVEAKKILSRENSPMIINYRVNAGVIPIEHWTQQKDIGGGRIIGEGCHFFDLMNFFIESEVESISADYINVDNQSVIAKDNVVTTIKYKNGSIGNLIYTSISSTKQSKEYIEVHSNGKSIIIDDFTKLKLFGFSRKDIELKKQNKGHEEQMIEFIKKVKGQKSELITINESTLAAKISIFVDSLLNFNKNLKQ